MCIARGCATLDIKAWCSVYIKVLDGRKGLDDLEVVDRLEVLDGHKGLDDLEVVGRS